MFRYDSRTTKCVLVAILILGLLVPPCVADVSAAPAMHGTEPGHGEGVPPERSGARGNSDADDNGRGPERGDGTTDKEDWNNGCGNDEDREDDNEGVCGPHREKPQLPVAIVSPKPPKPPKIVKPICKVVLWGQTPELFDGDVNVRDPRSEAGVLAESHGYVEYVVEQGTELQVLWWNEGLGHGGSPSERFACDAAEVVLVEPGFFLAGLD